MKGSEKQVAWAMDIKNGMINICDAIIKQFADTIPETAELYTAIKSRCEKFLEMIDTNPATKDASTDAKWWIDNREKLPNPIKIAEMVDAMRTHGINQEEALTQLFGF